MIDPQKYRLRESLVEAGLQHGHEDVPVEVGKVEVVHDGATPVAKYCNTPGHATLTAAVPPGDGQPMPLNVRVTFDCPVPQKRGFYTILGKASANGAVTLKAEKFIPEEALV